MWSTVTPNVRTVNRNTVGTATRAFAQSRWRAAENSNTALDQ